MMRATILSLLLCPTAFGQLMTEEQEALWRSYIPKISDVSVIAPKIQESLFYTPAQMPRAHQFQPLPTGSGADYTVFYSQKSRLNNIDKYTNGNEEAPWRDPGGLALCDRTKTTELRFVWLPPDGNGGLWPVVVWRGPLDPSNAVNMPTPTKGWKWIFPEGAIVGEVLLKKFADGTWAPYEVRMRLREIDDWDIEKEVPFASLAELRQVSGQSLEGAREETLRYDDDKHPNKAFDITGTVTSLPPISNAASLLRNATFKPATEGAEGFTAQDDENIVPARYLGGLFKDRDSCVNCHKHTAANVDRFGPPGRDWYGTLSGHDGIFSFLPIAKSSIGPPSKPVELEPRLVAAGIVAMFDQNKHPSSVYSIAKKYDNTPGPGKQRHTNGRMIVGGP